ncbi:MAG: hypothetical protein HOQ44_10025 [Nocardia sp.]|nr:hypothetical protein [Nocardia sp.]
MNSDLLVGDTGNTPAAIRQGIAATEERIAGAANSIGKALLSEELNTLQYELAQRS